MNTHPYLRAYMAGVSLPSLFLLLALTIFIMARLVFQIPIPIERVMIFPMALVPNLFGLWNVLYLWLRPRRHLPLGFHGALLPLIIFPLGAALGNWLGVLSVGENGLARSCQAPQAAANDSRRAGDAHGSEKFAAVEIDGLGRDVGVSQIRGFTNQHGFLPIP